MSDDLFKEGGPLNVRKTGPHQFRFSIPLPSGENKRLGRECPDVSCSPRYFKVKMGTGITANQIRAYCPYLGDQMGLTHLQARSKDDTPRRFWMAKYRMPCTE